LYANGLLFDLRVYTARTLPGLFGILLTQPHAGFVSRLVGDLRFWKTPKIWWMASLRSLLREEVVSGSCVGKERQNSVDAAKNGNDDIRQNRVCANAVISWHLKQQAIEMLRSLTRRKRCNASFLLPAVNLIDVVWLKQLHFME